MGKIKDFLPEGFDPAHPEYFPEFKGLGGAQ
jgi:hypothetical protein